MFRLPPSFRVRMGPKDAVRMVKALEWFEGQLRLHDVSCSRPGGAARIMECSGNEALHVSTAKCRVCWVVVASVEFTAPVLVAGFSVWRSGLWRPCSAKM